MDRKSIIEYIENIDGKLAQNISRNARFKFQPLRALWFYFLVALNRYTKLLIPITGKTFWGHKLYAYETSAIGSIYFIGFYDGDVSLFLLKHFAEEGDILDVGANIGAYTSLFTQIKHPSAQIHAFEPTPSTYGVLKDNVGKLEAVTCHQIALSDQSGTVKFYDYGHRHGVYNSTKAQYLPFLQKTGKEINVPTDTLDSWCQQNSIKPSLIKLDTEGTEASILKKGVEVIRTYKPTFLLEVGGGDAWGENNTNSINLLETEGYNFYNVTTEGTLIKHQKQNSYEYQNLIAIHNSKSSQYVNPS